MKSKLYIISAIILILIFSGLFINIQHISAAPHLDDLDSGSLLDALYAILLASLVLFLAAGLGGLLIKPFKLTNWSFAERTILGLPLGLAAIGYGEFFLGIIGWLQPLHQLLFLLVIAGIAFKDSIRFLSAGWAAIKSFKHTWTAFSWLKKLFFVVGLAALLLALLQTFTPPFDYDGLMYHLQGPRLFLEAGRIIPIPENWLTFFPSTWEMVYMLGMGLGSDVFAKLIHFSTLLLLILATYVFGKRFLSEKGGWLSSAMMVGMPMMLIWGGFAYIDMAWSLFQFLAIGLFLIWIKDRNGKYLVLSGIMQGLGLGVKYIALYGAAIIVLFVLWLSWKETKPKFDFKQTVTNLLTFGLPALIIALPWYAKNAIWTGNPFFPFFIQSEIINPEEMKIWFDYRASFGVGTRWYDYFLLPFNIYLNFYKFSSFVVFGDYPNPSFLLALIYPLIRKKIQGNRQPLDFLFIFTSIQFVIWATGSQQNRYLMPIFPTLSILAGSVIISLMDHKWRINWGRVIAIGLVGGMTISSLALMVRFMSIIRPNEYLFGDTSKSEFLAAYVKDYRAIEYINGNLPEDALVFMPWDGRGYYCDGKCYPDTGQSAWAALVQKTENIDNVSSWLRVKGMTHILISWDDVYFFVYEHDPSGVHDQALSFFLDDYAPKCAELVYEDDWTQLYELHLDDVSCQ